MGSTLKDVSFTHNPLTHKNTSQGGNIDLLAASVCHCRGSSKYIAEAETDFSLRGKLKCDCISFKM